MRHYGKMPHPEVELAPRLLNLPNKSEQNFIEQVRLDFTGDDEVALRKVDQAYFLGSAGGHVVMAARSYRKQSKGPEWTGPELYLVRFAKRRGNWRPMRSMFLRLDRYAIPLHDVLGKMLEGVNPCAEGLPSTSFGHWINASGPETDEL